VTAPEFLDFIEQSSKIVQRALNDKYDYIRDYAVSGEDGGSVTVPLSKCPDKWLIDTIETTQKANE
jgi:hypothetical protein